MNENLQRNLSSVLHSSDINKNVCLLVTFEGLRVKILHKIQPFGYMGHTVDELLGISPTLNCFPKIYTSAVSRPNFKHIIMATTMDDEACVF